MAGLYDPYAMQYPWQRLQMAQQAGVPMPQANPMRGQMAPTGAPMDVRTAAQMAPQQGGQPPQRGNGWPSVGQALGGLFSPQMLPMYLGMALGGTRAQQAQLASQGMMGANQLTQDQRQFDAKQGLAQQEMSALEKYRNAQLDMERQKLAMVQAEQTRANENPYLRGISQINEIPDTYLGGPEAAPVMRQQMVQSLFNIGESERSFAYMVRGESDLRKEVNSLPEVKSATEALTSYKRIVAAATNKSGPGDIAILFNYMKMLDPTSVVRESEYATAANAGGIPETVRSAYNRLLDGQKLSPEMRTQILTAAGTQATVYTQMLDSVTERYGPIADSYRYNRDRVLPQVPGGVASPTAPGRVLRYNPTTGGFE